MTDTDQSTLSKTMAMVVAQSNAIERLKVLALEWHKKNLTSERFATRGYEILYEHDKEVERINGEMKP